MQLHMHMHTDVLSACTAPETHQEQYMSLRNQWHEVCVLLQQLYGWRVFLQLHPGLMKARWLVWQWLGCLNGQSLSW